VYPGDIWGRYYLRYVDPDIGVGSNSQALLNTANKFTSSSTHHEILFSPYGAVPDPVDGCSYESDATKCFEHTASSQAGSSGSPMFATGGLNPYEVFGVHQGCWGWDGAWSDWDNHYDWGWFYTNYGSYIPNIAAAPIGGHLTFAAFVSGQWLAHVGGYGGTSRFLYCPTNEVAVGVVGTTENTSPFRVANFGLVCSPLESYSGGSRHNQDMHVIVGGSVDTGFVAGVYPFNEYLNETLEDGEYQIADLQQEIYLCGKGQWLYGIRVHDNGSVIQSVERIYCRDSTQVSQRYPLVTPIGTSPAGTTELRACTNATHGITGIFLRSGWLTDGFQLYCRNI